MKDVFIYTGDPHFISDPPGRISKNNPRIVINCARVQLCTSGTADALMSLLKDTSDGVLCRTRVYWLVAEPEDADSKLQAAVENAAMANEQTGGGVRAPESDIESLFNEHVAASDTQLEDILAQMSPQRCSVGS